MTDEELLDRIVLNPKVMVGRTTVRGTRLTVDFILNLLAHGATEVEILSEYEGLGREDILACILFAKRSLDACDFVPLAMEET